MPKFELVVVIINAGYSDQVMEAARGAGAKGGTVMSARGTSYKEIEEKYGIAISPEKEMMFILAESKCKEAIMKAVNEKVGLHTPGRGIAISLPVSNATGINLDALKEKKD